MAAERVGDMTLDELKQLINLEIVQYLQNEYQPDETRSVKEINDSIKRTRRVPRPGTPSTLELLRKDRDR